MAFAHHRWEKNGRLYRDEANPRKMKWTTAVSDDENVDIGGGNYAPYTWDGTTLKHGRMEMVFHPTHQEIKFEGNTKIQEQKFHLDFEIAPGVFTQVKSKNAPTVSVQENDDHAVVSLTFNVTHPVSDDPIEWKTSFKVGHQGNTGVISQNIKSPVVANARVRSTNIGLNKTERDEPITAISKEVGPITTGRRVGGIDWKWARAEAADRSVNVNDNVATKGLEVAMAVSLEAGIEKVISPDTWGSTEITVDANDGHEYDENWNLTGDYDGFFCGERDPRGDRTTAGIRFTGIPASLVDASSIDTGSHVTYDVNYGQTVTVTVSAVEANNPAIFEDTTPYLPYDQTVTTASGSVSSSAPSSDNQSSEMGGVGSCLQEWHDTVTPVSGGAISFRMNTTSGTTQIIDSSDLQSGSYSACRLTIAYTAAATGTRPHTLSGPFAGPFGGPF